MINNNIISLVALLLQSQIIDLEKISIKTLAKRCQLTELIIKRILDGMPISEEMAVKLERGTNISSEVWIFLNRTDVENTNKSMCNNSEDEFTIAICDDAE